jgi:hypothetical protein
MLPVAATIANRHSCAFVLFLGLVFSGTAKADESGSNDAQPRTGQYNTKSFVAELTDEATRRHFQGFIPESGEIEWSVYVPESYLHAKPAGLVVNISPSNRGKIPGRWKSVMDQHNLIWIGANQSGNKVMVGRRMMFAVLAPYFTGRHYRVDSNRVYLSGLSGGGRVSSTVAVDFANMFKGAIYSCGVNPLRESEPSLIEFMRENRYVFLSGTRDFNLMETKRVFRSYDSLGLEKIKLMVIEGMGHENPNVHDFEEAIRFLDSSQQ